MSHLTPELTQNFGFRSGRMATPWLGVMNRPDVLALFSSQYWVASIQQLDALDVSDSTVKRARRDGTIETVVPGIVQVAGTPRSFHAKAMILQLHAGETSFISGVSAAALHGLRAMPRTLVEVTATESHQFTMPPWGRLVRSSWVDWERDVVTRPDGIRVASPLRMLFRLAKVFNEHRFDRAAEDCWHLGLLTPAVADEYLAAVRRQGRTGVARFERWLLRTRRGSGRARAASSSTSSTPCAVPACPSRRGSTR